MDDEITQSGLGPIGSQLACGDFDPDLSWFWDQLGKSYLDPTQVAVHLGMIIISVDMSISVWRKNPKNWVHG